MFSGNKLRCNKYVFKQRIDSFYLWTKNSEFTTMCDGNEWIMQLKVVNASGGSKLVFCLSVRLEKEAKINTEVKLQFLSGEKFFITENVTFKSEKTKWTVDKEIFQCLASDRSLTIVCEVEVIEPFPLPPPPCSLVEDFETMLSSENHSDVIIECDDKDLKAHRVVLAARCPVFASMLSHGTQESMSGRIKVSDTGSEAMAPVLKYLYSGRIPSQHPELVETISAAGKCQLPRLKAACERELLSNITPQNACRILLSVEKHQLVFIKQALLRYIKSNIQEVIESDGWTDLVFYYPLVVSQLSAKFTENKALQGEPLPPCSLVEDFGSMLTSGHFADVIIECNGNELKAHRAVLAARCPVFGAMFSHDTSLESQSGRIVVPDIGSEGMAALLNYIYTGRIPSQILLLPETIMAADKYQLPRLNAACERDLISHITVQNAIPVLITAEKYHLATIKQYLLKYIQTNIQEVFKTKVWVDIISKCYEVAAENLSAKITVKHEEERQRHLDDASSGSDSSDAKRRCLK